jgi:hypothetical protein
VPWLASASPALRRGCLGGQGSLRGHDGAWPSSSTVAGPATLRQIGIQYCVFSMRWWRRRRCAGPQSTFFAVCVCPSCSPCLCVVQLLQPFGLLYPRAFVFIPVPIYRTDRRTACGSHAVAGGTATANDKRCRLFRLINSLLKSAAIAHAAIGDRKSPVKPALHCCGVATA